MTGQYQLSVQVVRFTGTFVCCTWSTANLTYCLIVCADCEEVVELLCQTWLRELMASSNTNSSSTNEQPDLLLQLDEHQVLPCTLQQHLLQLDPWLLPAHLCPCHSLPMHPPTGSSSSAAAAAAGMGPDSDAATAAGLLLLPEEAPWRCGVTRQPVLQPLSSCCTNTSVLQLGRHTQLTAAPTFKHGTSSSSISSGVGRHAAVPVTALVLPAGQPCVLSVKHVVGLQHIDSMMIYGMPLVASPAINTSCSGNNTATAAAAVNPAQAAQRWAEGGSATGSSGEDAGMLMRVVCQLLLEQQQVLLAASSHDIHRRCQTPLQHWYMLQPAADGCSLLLRCMATREQLLPPKGYMGATQVRAEAAESRLGCL